ncbi:MthZ:modification methylase [Desulfosarcina variabilis str. Montpellier]|uniref:DNA-methyltransferase n=1 Tax=Desulfosarcina variabilis TaxID=2300 RepID=UPI003AFAAAC8
MRSEHQLHFSNSRNMDAVPSQSVHLVVTSPPYPMIEMWDELFCRSAKIDKALRSGDGNRAFELMHQMLDSVWDELYRILVPGGIVCINIGDATRTLNDRFALYSNHTRIASKMLSLGFSNLPNILWRKQTNAPNKFMGSGMMPPGAYVTLEHEYILVFRKGDKRLFKSAEEKTNRRQSAYFWEERNQWFSDVWMDLKGTRQNTQSKKLRNRSGAYPFELAYRLISMFSVIGDTVLDPFLGTGTTLFAAAAAARNSIGYELDKAFRSAILEGIDLSIDQARNRIKDRLDDHRQFVRDRQAAGKAIKHTNQVYGFPVVTRQESELMLPLPTAIGDPTADRIQVEYEMLDSSTDNTSSSNPKRSLSSSDGQLLLFDP